MRQEDRKRRAFSWYASDVDSSVMGIDDRMNNGQAQPGSLIFGGEERIENSGLMGGINSWTSVGNRQADPRPSQRRLVGFRELERQDASGGHGLNCVQDQIQHHLLELSLIAPDRRNARIEVEPDINGRLRDGMRRERQRIQHQGFDRLPAACVPFRLRVGQ